MTVKDNILSIYPGLPIDTFNGLSGSDLVVARLQARLGPAEAAMLAGITVASLQRQEHGETRASVCLTLLLRILTGQRLPWPAWQDWGIRDGKLYPPHYRQGYAPSDIVALHWLRQLVADQRVALAADPRLERNPGALGERIVGPGTRERDPAPTLDRGRRAPTRFERAEGLPGSPACDARLRRRQRKGSGALR